MKNWKLKLGLVILLIASIYGLKFYVEVKDYEDRKINNYKFINNCVLEIQNKESDPKRYRCDTGNWTELQLIHNALDVPDDRLE